MIIRLRPLLICLLAYAVALGLTLLALSVMLDLGSIGFDTQVPRSAVLTPMIAVVAFWGTCRLAGVPLDPARSFLIGAIVVYGLLFFMGRIVALTQISHTLAALTAATILLVGCYAVIARALTGRAEPL